MEHRMHLTPRLRAIMEMVSEGTSLADIGTDHALLPVALLQRGTITAAIASDIGQGPLESAARTARQFGYEEKLSLRLGPGLTTLQPQEADTIVIAGMGGETIVGILQQDPWALDGTHDLLLQAMTGQAELRKYLAEQGGIIEQERICREGKRLYTILAVRGGGAPVEQTLAESVISEALCHDPMAAAYLTARLAKERQICTALESARKPREEELQYHRDTARVLERALYRVQEQSEDGKDEEP